MADVQTASPLPPAPRKRRLWRPMLIMVVVVLVIVAIIAGVKFVQISALIAQSKQPMPAAVVTALHVPFEDWQPSVTAVGSIKAVRGVDVTTEVGGIVRTLGFKPGQEVAAQALLGQLDDGLPQQGFHLPRGGDARQGRLDAGIASIERGDANADGQVDLFSRMLDGRAGQLQPQ